MSELIKIHQEAMMLAEQAIQAKNKGNLVEALALNEKAFEKELFVATSAQKEMEPTRSILLRSAATLALRSNKPEESIKLVHLALSGNPPPDIKFELNELLQEATFGEHLALNGIELSNEEIQLSLSGSLVAPGVIEADCFLQELQR